MKKSYFTGTILLGFGLYYLLYQYQLTPFPNFYSWPTLILIIGLGFLSTGYLGKEYEAILPGVFLTGIGLHFHISHYLEVWPDITGVLILLIALGTLLRYLKTGSGLSQGIIFLIVAILLLFLDRIKQWAVVEGLNLSLITKGWPYILIICGIYFLYSSRKK